MATIKDVAKEAKVAISTVSNVLNNIDVVKQETKEKVLEAVQKLNYTPNLNGKYLKKTETKVLGLFITNLEGPFYNDLISAMYAQCCDNNYNLTIFLNNEHNLLESYQAILGKRVDGAIILNDTIKEIHVETFRKLKMPIVFLDREVVSDTITSVVIDNYNGMHQATEYLLKTGHSKIGYIHGNSTSYDEKMRYAGYADALKQYHIPTQEDWEIQGCFSEPDTYHAVKKYITSGQKLPDAFLAANDEMAIGCIEALRAEGIKVPEDISVIGFDNIEKTSYYIPQITTTDSATKELGKTAVEKLMQILNKETPQGICRIPSKLVIRDSCQSRI